MKMFDVYYSGVITIEAETEEEAKDIFDSRYFDYGSIDEVEDVTNEYEDDNENSFFYIR